jgi:long-chain acyl-CoA synthetase
MLLRDVLSHAVKLWPEKVAIIDGDTRYTYRQSAERVSRLAAGLHALGVKPGENIAILANNSHRYMETYFVADVAGTPLAPLNIRLAPRELEFILNDGEVKALFLGPEFVDLYNRFRANVPGLKQVILMGGGEAGESFVDYEQLVRTTEPPRAPRESGWKTTCSTSDRRHDGLPKGVMLSQRNVVSNAQHAIMTFGFNERDTWLHVAPMFHLADAWACYAVTMVGGLHVFIPGFAPQATLEAIQQYEVTKTILVPTMINAVLNFPALDQYDKSSLDTILYGASPMPVDRLQAAVQAFGPKWVQAYGMTETAPFQTAMKAQWLRYDGSESDNKRLASCGREISGVEVRVVDPTTGEDVKPGEVGEVIARGPNVMIGYWKRGKESAEALRGGYMHTGDLATVDEENFIYIVDRAKDMIISGGENIYSSEVESAIYEHPAVLEAAVVGVPDDQWGEAVLAVIVPNDGATVTAEEIIAHCHTLIAGYKCPKRVVVQQEPLPKSGPGKILKTEIRKPYWEGQARMVH